MSALPPTDRRPPASRQETSAAPASGTASFVAAHAIALLAVAATVIALTEALLQLVRLLRAA